MTEAQLSNAMDAYGSTVYRLALTRMQNIADAEDVYAKKSQVEISRQCSL